MHLEEHPHALLDDNNNVINVAVFEEHDAELLEIIKTANNAVATVCCCDNGVAVIGGKWNGVHFLDAEGNRVPKTPYPKTEDNTLYEYDFEIDEWVEVVLPTPVAPPVEVIDETQQ